MSTCIDIRYPSNPCNAMLFVIASMVSLLYFVIFLFCELVVTVLYFPFFFLYYANSYPLAPVAFADIVILLFADETVILGAFGII